jgi:hypothetical protein
MVLEETAHVVAQYWSATGRPASEAPTPDAPGPEAPTAEAAASNGDRPATRARSNGNGGRHLRRPAGRHERRR